MEIKSKLLVFVPQGIILLTQFSLIPLITFNTKNTGLWISVANLDGNIVN